MSTMPHPVRSAVHVDLDAIRDNVAAAGSIMGPSQVMAVVKSDGYGHGAGEVAGAALASGASAVGVAFVEEGVRLRAAVPEAPIVVFTEPFAGEEAEALWNRLTLSISSAAGAGRIAAAAERLGRPASVHLKIDTGLHRLGVASHEVPEVIGHARGLGLRIEALWTHFATADQPADPHLSLQLDRFLSAATAVPLAANAAPPVKHAANSAAALTEPRSRLDMVRLGAVLYGIRPGTSVPGLEKFRPALTWRSSVIAVRSEQRGERVGYGLRYRLDADSTIAVVPVGYGDGLPRALSNRGEVIVAGRRRRIAGAVGMSHTLVDCQQDPVRAGDPVFLLGRTDAGDGSGCDVEISTEEFAQWSGSSVYEVVTRISPGTPRYYQSRGN